MCRFLYALPQSPLGHRETRPDPISEDALDGYTTSMRYLLRLPCDTDETGRRQPQLLTLSQDADELLEEYESWLEPQLAPTGRLGAITDWSGKLFGATARIAGLLHLAENTSHVDQWSTLIEVSTIEAAIRIGRYLIPHAKTAYGMMGADPAVEQARHLVTWLTERGEPAFTKRDAFNANRGHFQQVKDLAPALQLLEEHAYIRTEEMPPRNRGRPPSQRYAVNPNLWSHKTQNPQKPEEI